MLIVSTSVLKSQRKEADDRLAEVQITQSRALVKEAEDDKTDPSKNILLALESFRMQRRIKAGLSFLPRTNFYQIQSINCTN